MEKYKIQLGYLYKDSFSEKEFIDAVLKNILDDTNAPSYIFDEMTLSNVSRIDVPLILSDGNSEIEYSRMIGFDRIETTTKYKTTTYGSGYQNRTHSTSSRTITDWENDSGVITGSSKSGIFYDEYKIYDEYITNHQMDRNNVRELTSEELNNYYLTSDDIEYMKNDILNKVYNENITYPGNQVKNEEYYGKTELYNTTVTIVSLYTVTLTVRDKTIQFIASSNGDIDIDMFGEYLFDNYEEINKYRRKISTERLMATKKPRAIAKYSLLLSLLLFVLFLILGITLSILALTIMSIVILVLGLIITIIFMMNVKKISKPYYKKIYDYNKNDYNRKLENKEIGYRNYLNKLN